MKSYTITLFFSLLVCIVLIPSQTLAQKPLEHRVGVDENNPLSLSLKETINTALENNNDIAIMRVEVKQARNDLDLADGSYDPTINFGQFFVNDRSPTISILAGSNEGKVTTNALNSEFSFQGLLRSGAQYKFTATSTYVDTSNNFVNLNTHINNSIGFNLVKPLLRNRKIDQARLQIKVAQKKLDLTDSQFRQRVIQIIAQVELAYWELYFARENVEIQRQAVNLAEAQLVQTKNLIESGKNAQVELLQVESHLRERQEAVLVAIEQVTRTENQLKFLILPDRNASQWQRAIILTDKPEYKTSTFDIKNLVEIALSNSDELRQLQFQEEINETEKTYLLDQVKPKLDFLVSYTMIGLSGNTVNRPNVFASSTTPLFQRINEISKILNLSPVPVTPTNPPDFIVGGARQSIINLVANRFSNFRIGIQLQLPLKGTVNKAELAKNLANNRKILLNRKKIESRIESEVRNTVQSLRTIEERMQAAQATLKTRQGLLESEQRRYSAGLSTSLQVLACQQNLTESLGHNLRVTTDYSKALTELQQIVGAILSKHNVTVE